MLKINKTCVIALLCIASFGLADKGMAEQTLERILAKQPEAVQARYAARHPQETLEFFQIQPGMKVVEVLPGGGWYSKILLEFLGEKGQLVGMDFDIEMWPHVGSFATEAFLDKRKKWPSTWVNKAREWGIENSASVSAATFADSLSEQANSVDAVLFIRALHGLARTNEKGQFLDNALQQSYAILKPGGIVGIVQHAANENRADDWANGANGYLKPSFVKKAMAEAGFEFVAESDINFNPKDEADVGDIVWRLSPSNRVPEGASETEIAALKAIGESNRMTMLFRKPVSENQ